VVTINGVAVHTTLHKLDGGYMMAVNKEVQARIGAAAGDQVHVAVQRAEPEPTVDVPDDLAAALTESGAQQAFDRLTAFRRSELIKSVTSARRPETRTSRIGKAIHNLSG
jgi:uncharacterized protein YdeI (YjbR/CyaY-like superfamily)